MRARAGRWLGLCRQAAQTAFTLPAYTLRPIRDMRAVPRSSQTSRQARRQSVARVARKRTPPARHAGHQAEAGGAGVSGRRRIFVIARSLSLPRRCSDASVNMPCTNAHMHVLLRARSRRHAGAPNAAAAPHTNALDVLFLLNLTPHAQRARGDGRRGDGDGRDGAARQDEDGDGVHQAAAGRGRQGARRPGEQPPPPPPSSSCARTRAPCCCLSRTRGSHARRVRVCPSRRLCPACPPVCCVRERAR